MSGPACNGGPATPAGRRQGGNLRRFGLRAALFGLALSGLVPVALLFLAGAVDARRDARQQVADDARLMVRSAAVRHDRLVGDGPAVLRAALSIGGAQADPAACTDRLRALLAALPHLGDLGIADGQGRVLCRAGAAPGNGDVAGQAWFRRAAATGGFVTGDYEAASYTGRPALVMGLPRLSPDGHVEQVAFAAVGPAWLEDTVGSTRLAGEPRATIIDPRGVIVARHPRPEDWVGQLLPERPRGAVLGRGEGVADIEGLDGVSRLYVFAPLGRPPTGYVIMAAPTGKAYAEANAELRRNLLLVGLLSLAGMAGARMVGRRLIVTPAQAVVATSRRLAAGDLAARVEGRRPPGELGAVSEAFDEMAEALEDREAALDKAGEELRRSQAQLQAILDSAPAAIFLQDLAGRYLLVNRGFETLTGTAREAALGRTDRELVGEEVAAPLEAHLADVLAGGGPVERREVLSGPGGERTFQTLRFPLVADDGRVYALCGIAQDVTEELRAEAERAALQEQVQRSQRLESLGLLAGGVAHDFNNLLGIIISYTEFALESVIPGPLPPDEAGQVQEDLGAVLHAARSASGLTRQLLVFARRDRGDDSAEPEPCDVNEVLDSLRPLLQRTVPAEVDLELDLSPLLPPVRADPLRLEQVVVNLVVNARDAMPQGGGLRVSTEAVTGPEGEDRVRLTVSDTGTGMAPEVAERAFDPFFTTKGQGQGTGLGLATVYGIVTGIGGSVSIHSRPGEGTHVVVELPADTAAAGAQGGEAGPGRGSGVPSGWPLDGAPA